MHSALATLSGRLTAANKLEAFSYEDIIAPIVETAAGLALLDTVTILGSATACSHGFVYGGHVFAVSTF